jgi:hypothetical protein
MIAQETKKGQNICMYQARHESRHEPIAAKAVSVFRPRVSVLAAIEAVRSALRLPDILFQLLVRLLLLLGLV